MANGERLFLWYQKNKRPLPWRKNPNPYRIWIAEIMLQQTTVQTVIPYYKKFLKKFPTLKSLTQNSIDEILPYWSGLGYYSRVKNLHQSAQLFIKQTKGKIPKTAKELEKYPGFGPYTSKAVSSQAYGEPVSVLDGNVIRFFCRHENLSIEWWKKKEQLKLEKIADHWRQNLPPGDMNQAFMEIGATVCLPHSPLCHQCPVSKTCKAKKSNRIAYLPLKKPRKKREIWLWKPQIIFKNRKIALTQEHCCPFLKREWLPPGSIRQLNNPPKKYDFRHSITHYDIFVQIEKNSHSLKKRNQINCIPKKKNHWQAIESIQKIAPFSLVTKILERV